jgi:uncharacterized protein (DUF3820 family)
MDDRTREFMELVDCEEWEVQDVISPDKMKFGDTSLTFGKYKGWRIRDVPGNYLTWLADQPSSKNGVGLTLPFKKQLHIYLCTPHKDR